MRPNPDPARNFSSKSTDQFFQEIQNLSAALSISNPRRHSLPSNPNPSPKPANKSLWKTIRNPLKSLSLLRQSRFDCFFSIQIHSIRNLPSSLSSSAFVVHFKRVSDNTGSRTRPVKAVNGSVEFQETLLHNCSVYGSSKGSVAKYESREFIVYVNLAGSTGYDFGKNKVEITKILPVVFDDLYGEKRTGKWSTSFGLGGRARGAVLNVTFGYCVNESNEKNGSFRRSGSIKGVNFCAGNQNVAVKELDNPPELKHCTMVEEAGKNECEELEFTVIDKGVEFESNNFVEEDKDCDGNKETEACNRQNEVNCASHVSPITEMNVLESLEADLGEIRSNRRSRGMSRSLSLDDLTENIASEFLSKLENTPDNDAESPRDQLLKQFEYEGFEFGVNNSFDFSSVVNEAETEHHKSRAKMLEDEEAEALMREWGLNAKVFEGSMPNNSGDGFGSPISLPMQELKELPPLGENLDSFIQTKDGGFLRSMSPSLFKDSRNGGSLVMQASSPIVLPAEMGSDIVEILKGLASIGIEKLSMQASKLMPLEDITGKTMQQIAWEASSSQELCARLDLFEIHNVDHVSSRTRKGNGLKKKPSMNQEENLEYVSLEDLAPLAMDKIEALSIEGLRIQSGVSNEEAPSNISPQFIRSNDNENTSIGLQLLGVEDNAGDVDGLMGLSLTLDEWMKFDSGAINEEDKASEKTTRILEAHHAKSIDFLRAGKNNGKKSGKKWGLLGNNFTVAIMVQLRDPLRNYEHVGTPMLALIQVERVVVPPKPKIYRSVFESKDKEEDDELVEKAERKIKEPIPQFKITEVHIAGVETEPSSKKKSVWGSLVKPQSGSRWLLANGMGKGSKHPFMKSNPVKMAAQATTKVQPGETLWSISSRVLGSGSKWKELAALNPHIRNPNVIFPNETIKLR